MADIKSQFGIKTASVYTKSQYLRCKTSKQRHKKAQNYHKEGTVQTSSIYQKPQLQRTLNVQSDPIKFKKIPTKRRDFSLAAKRPENESKEIHDGQKRHKRTFEFPLGLMKYLST